MLLPYLILFYYTDDFVHLKEKTTLKNVLWISITII